MENQISQTKQETCWSPSDKSELVKALSIIANGQKQYGKEVILKDILDYYEMKLSRSFTVRQVLHALDLYTNRHNDMPAPSDLINILNPEPARISQAEFIHAKDQWAKEGYPSYSYYATIVKQYEKENAEERAPQVVTDYPALLEVARKSIAKF